MKTPRAEFSRWVKAAARKRANDHCEACGKELREGQFHYDHILAEQLSHDSRPSNCQCLCLGCHKDKTARDLADIAKSNRIRQKHAEHLARMAEKGKLP